MNEEEDGCKKLKGTQKGEARKVRPARCSWLCELPRYHFPMASGGRKASVFAFFEFFAAILPARPHTAIIFTAVASPSRSPQYRTTRRRTTSAAIPRTRLPSHMPIMG